ncbi:PDR/VanB family oxidoreductase [Paraburkholderia xenovorans]|uniref:PDR/VanB family oxidoreductase n=1 Tax=Paraburkholderia xenovorans TaxID=36873 RepID=UPI001559556A|nr:PDR/VanB family oxidoreductase [Paraburkholderia xenovorans]NPT38782.1 2Fe-2S iron-sulfur cluster binding domain-containing protein [Paraburkholderia xenovorans]
MDVIVEKITEEATDIKSLRLVSPVGAALPSFEAGAHIDVHVGGTTRQYSLCSDPADTSAYLIGVKLEAQSRGGSKAVHALKEGDHLEISAPRNLFALAAGSDSALLIGAGIGITPLIAMMYQLKAQNKAFTLHYFARSQDHIAFSETLLRTDAELDFGRVHFHLGLDAPATGGQLDQLLARPENGQHVYFCGPGPFMEAIRQRCEDWPKDAVHFEYFSAEPVEVTDEGFEVIAARSGKRVWVGPEQSITDALNAAGVEVCVSCEQGICGTCLTAVLNGTPIHNDMFLNDAEKAKNDQMLPCISRASSRTLTLNI